MFNAIYSIGVLAAISYFGFAAIQGQYGLARLVEIESVEGDLTQTLASMRSERRELQNRTRRLSDDFLDLDLLDETSRQTLGLARADEVIIR